MDRTDYVTSTEIASHSSKLTNDRIDKILVRIDYFCEACLCNPSKENLQAYHATQKNLFNAIWMIVKDDKDYLEMLKVLDAVKIKLDQIKESKSRSSAGWFPEKEYEEKKLRLTLKSQCLTDLDFTHQVLIGALQELNYFFRTDDQPIKGAKNRLMMLQKRGNLGGKVSIISKKEEGLKSGDSNDSGGV